MSSLSLGDLGRGRGGGFLATHKDRGVSKHSLEYAGRTQRLTGVSGIPERDKFLCRGGAAKTHPLKAKNKKGWGIEDAECAGDYDEDGRLICLPHKFWVGGQCA